jgi:hypothetical protein
VDQFQKIRSKPRRTAMMRMKIKRISDLQVDSVELDLHQVREVSLVYRINKRILNLINNKNINRIRSHLMIRLVDSVVDMTRTLMMNHLISTIGKNAQC